LRLGVVEMLPTRMFSLHPNWPLDTGHLRAQTLRYVNPALKRAAAEFRGNIMTTNQTNPSRTAQAFKR
jgi:hypothetical protein